MHVGDCVGLLDRGILASRFRIECSLCQFSQVLVLVSVVEQRNTLGKISRPRSTVHQHVKGTHSVQAHQLASHNEPRSIRVDVCTLVQQVRYGLRRIEYEDGISKSFQIDHII